MLTVYRSLLAYWRGTSSSSDGGSSSSSSRNNGCFMHFDSCAHANDSAAKATAEVIWRALYVDSNTTSTDDSSSSGGSPSGLTENHHAAGASVQLPPLPVVQSAAEWMPRQRNGVRSWF